MNPDVVNEIRMMNSPMTHPYDPAAVPSWKYGKQDIVVQQVHPPCRVRRKVYEFSGVLPDTIKLELVLHGDICQSLFDNYCPGKEDVGLYFFARWNNEHFLWGLFYRMRQDKDRCVEGGSHDSWRK
ncbi:hypothetical protein KY290_021136 [Solanum tuberosum]|uniref:AIPP2-like SPOC-like domain-containing protein n=1 Tax=Solanum tuberosum TaxID=4113 RepID=A0ABQ7V2P8_SOLTU|nr:hypothetical protein KY289_020308 [Solanum tuberosum]KAH0692970.1 hypothetical protein KY285_020067 [Solanum tuberosum]KAH0757643.1 hypothetical protein KY290_021136 [Solanum tuberosum]